jgi:pimeloyl-ACP methyl ester carboxylesterase/DNA-binding CsgD family transcriptional regulator
MQQRIQFCRTDDGVRIAYGTSGQGAPLVKAANWLSHLEYDLQSPVWRHWIAELSRGHTFVRYDARGCGLSDWDVPELSFEAWVRDLETVIDAARMERFALLGLSQGGAIAIAYAVRHPERVTHLVLHGAFARGALRRDPTPRQRKEAEMMVELAELGWGKENPAFRQFFTSLFIPDGTPEQHRWWNRLEQVSTSPANAARFMRVLGDIDVTAIAPRVACPTLVLHAVRDARIPFEEGRLLASLVPGARFVPIESGNHVLLEHEPAWQRWLEEVRAFLPIARGGVGAFARLTRRQSELVELIAQGLDNAQIAARVGVSEKTVRNHITAIFAKLDVANRSRAIVLARDAGFGKKTS